MALMRQQLSEMTTKQTADNDRLMNGRPDASVASQRLRKTHAAAPFVRGFADGPSGIGVVDDGVPTIP